MVKFSDLLIDDGQPKGRTAFAFPYSGAKLMEASAKQAEYHRQREAFYQSENDRLEVEIREKGLTLREQQVTGGPRFTADLDREAGEQLALARQKRDGHAQSARTFEAYVGAFSTQQGQQFFLTIGDVDWFALHRDPG